MSQSLREQILQTVMARLQPVAAASGAQLLRSPTTGISREAAPALLLIPESEVISERFNDRVERQLIVRLVALTRATTSEEAETLADRLLVEVHRALFADVNFGGLGLGLREVDCDWQFEDADTVAAALPVRYEIRYRTLVSDISQPG